MNKFKSAIVVSSLFATILAAGISSAVIKQGNRLVVNLKGTGDMYLGTVPDVDGDGVDDSAMCFDVDAVDLNRDAVVGTGTDCLVVVSDPGDPLSIVGTTYLNLHGNNSIVTRGVTTVQPATGLLGNFTHVTGAAPSGCNDVLSGTGAYAGATGSARLSGMVDMSGFAGAVGEPISFDCVFVIDLD